MSTSTFVLRVQNATGVDQRSTSSTALGRIASPDEIVGTALYLASDASSYLNGELIVLDGG